MPTLETPDEFVEALADEFNIYGACTRLDEGGFDDPAKDCQGCRICWTEGMAERMRAAVDNERMLAKLPWLS